MIIDEILIIEDDPDILAIVTLALQFNYGVETASNLSAADEISNRFYPDLVLIDYNIGQYTASKIIPMLRLKKGFEAVPIILFSADQQIKKLAVELGAAAFLPKPLELADLYTCVKNVLSKSTSAKEAIIL